MKENVATQSADLIILITSKVYISRFLKVVYQIPCTKYSVVYFTFYYLDKIMGKAFMLVCPIVVVVENNFPTSRWNLMKILTVKHSATGLSDQQ